MNKSSSNNFDAGKAAELCKACAATYLYCGNIRALSTDTHVRITRTETEMVIAFRGTNDVRNWLTDLDCAWVLEDRCRVHRGFAWALDSVESQINAEVFSPQREGRRIWLTGHSLGGALAMLYAWRFFNSFGETPFRGIYTFGQPRVGNAAFRDSYNLSPELSQSTFRIVHADDVVPRIPWLLGSYRHAGHEIFFPSVGRMPSSGAGSGDPAYRADPSIAAKLPWDWRNAWRELRHGKLALLADHRVDTYLGLFGTTRANAAMRGEVSRTSGRARPPYRRANAAMREEGAQARRVCL